MPVQVCGQKKGSSRIGRDYGAGSCGVGAYPFDVVTFRAPSALTAGHFFSWKKVTKNRSLRHPALRCAAGPLASVLLREDRAVRPLLGLSAFRPSMASTSLRKTCARPPEVAGRSRARSRSRSTARATAGESLRSRFVYLPAVLWGGWQGCALRFELPIPASSRGKPAPTGIAPYSQSAQSL
ncbi:hypothetical protein J3B00_003626 [Pseudomonas sp. BP8]|nr:hypothetical protein [Pseudomonas sp. BP8]